MPAKPFEASVRHQTDALPPAAVIDLHGEINVAAEARLNAAYAEAEGQNPPSIVLNFGDVSYINSTGIALIVGLLAPRARPSAACLSTDSARTTRRSSRSRGWPIS